MVLQIKPYRENIDKDKAIEEVTQEKTVRLSINIPKSLHTEFKIATIRDNTDMTDIVLKWVKEYIHK